MFRTFLPHEPSLPPNELGYVLIQGAFTPTKLDSEASDESYLSPNYWTNHRETFRMIIQQQFATILDNNKGGNDSGSLQTCEILDNDKPPFTKVRLKFESAAIAQHTAAPLFRRLTPQQLLKDTPYPFTTAQRPLHVVLQTTQPHIEPSWKRTSPPKFRRLVVPAKGQSQELLDHERRTTRFVMLTHLEPGVHNNELVETAIRAVVAPYDTSGHGVEVFLTARNCHVGMRSAHDAQQVVNHLQGTVLLCGDDDDTVISHGLFVDYAAITDRSAARAAARQNGEEPLRGDPSRPQCTSTTADIEIPGLYLIPDFVSEAEEAVLVAVLTGPQAPWAPSQRTASFQGGIVKRAVQHYGYVFDYQTANVLRDRTEEGASCPSLPAIIPEQRDRLEEYIGSGVSEGLGWNVLAGVVERTRRHVVGGQQFPLLNQLTVNCYQPGEGIGTHIDTPSAFSDGLISISLNSGIIMEFRKGTADRKKLVYLPPRSLLLMSGDARYKWEHMIVTRSTDTVDDKVLVRGLRVSLTLRTALDAKGSPMPLVESPDRPPVWGGAAASRLAKDPLATPACEREHVHAVYDAIATQWHHTRGKRGVLWPGATAFLQQLPAGSVVADVGCGDGKYFPAIWEAGSYVIGTDISEPLLRTALPSNAKDDVPESRRVDEKRSHLRDRPAVAVADCMNIPLRSHSCDAAICIAVLHHLSTFERRQRCLEELVRIVKPGGLINVQAWAMDQEQHSRRKFAANDVFVPFNAQPKYLKMGGPQTKTSPPNGTTSSKSTAQQYSEAFSKAEYDDKKGLVVFKRYCHLYKKGELEDIVEQVENVEVVESGFESGNYYIILRTTQAPG